ncbi:proteinase-activated receptor 1-like isoform X2 [Lineus longissimus]|uniref:proteinase-activated receptor 1-like isoform X2 n=1 Tax=Lineus longissimus TaxID=88925 RepID=UPI00315D4F1D
MILGKFNLQERAIFPWSYRVLTSYFDTVDALMTQSMQTSSPLGNATTGGIHTHLDSDMTTKQSAPFTINLFPHMYGALAPVALGVPGNLMAILVATRRHNRNLSPCIYMMAMGIADTALLLELAWAVGFALLLRDGIIESAEWIMKFHVYVLYTSAMLSGLFLAEMSVDRMLAVKYPMAASRLCTTKRAKIFVIVTTLVILTLNLYLLYIGKATHDPALGIHFATFDIPDYPALEVFTSAYQVVVGTVFPFLIILTCNVVIIVTLNRAVKERNQLESGKNSEKFKRDTNHLTKMLLFVSFAYVLITLPYRMYHLVIKIPEVALLFGDLRDTFARFNYVVQAWSLLNFWSFNFAVNFYLYCIGGGQRYRKDAKDVLRSCCTWNDF